MSRRSSNGLLPEQVPDVEAGGPTEGSFDEKGGVSELLEESDPFDIADTKNAPIETLRRWRVRTLYVYSYC